MAKDDDGNSSEEFVDDVSGDWSGVDDEEESESSDAFDTPRKPVGNAKRKNLGKKSRAGIETGNNFSAGNSGAGSGSTGKGKGKTKARTPQGGVASSRVGGMSEGEVAGTSPATPVTVASTPEVVQSTGLEGTKKGAGKTVPVAGDGKGGQSAGKTPKAIVRDYMTKANRPFSAINVFDNTHKKIPKLMVSKILDELVAEGTLSMQEYGKAKIYFLNQDNLPDGTGDISQARLDALEKEGKELEGKLRVVSAEAREAEARVRMLSSQATDGELEARLREAQQKIAELEAKNASIRDKSANVSTGDMRQSKAEFSKYRALWVNRKRNAMDIVDTIADGMDKKRKHVLEILDLEVDEVPIPAKL